MFSFRIKKEKPSRRLLEKIVDDILSVTDKAKGIFTLFYWLAVYDSSSQKSTFTHEYP